MSTIETASGKIWYEDNRDPTVHSPPLLLIHGAGADHTDWPAELRRLPDSSVIAPDLPGHGRSPGKGHTSITGYAADMVALLDALHIERAIVAGHSMGGAIAQTIALNYPQRVAGLLLVATSARLQVNDAILNGIRTKTAETIALIGKWGWSKDAPEQIRRLWRSRQMATDPEITYGDYVACNHFDVRERLGRARTPCLLISGSVDKMTPPDWMDDTASRIAGSKLVRIEGCGHWVMLEQPETVAAAVTQWLSEI